VGLIPAQLGRLDTALGIAGEADSESKWKQLGELAMSSGKLDVRPILSTHLSLRFTSEYGKASSLPS